MTDQQIVEAAKKIDTPHGKISLIHVRDDGQEVPTVMARQFANAIITGATAESAMKQFKECMGDEVETPLERLRFFCSLAITNGDDWLDSEQFFDALEAQLAKAAAV